MSVCFGKNGNKRNSHASCRNDSIKREIIQLKQEIMNVKATTYDLEYSQLKSKLSSENSEKMVSLSHQNEAREEAIKMLENRVEELEDAELWTTPMNTTTNKSNTSATSMNGGTSDGSQSTDLSFRLDARVNDDSPLTRYETSSSSAFSNCYSSQADVRYPVRSLYFDQRRKIRQLDSELRLYQEENSTLKTKNQKLEKLISILLLDDDATDAKPVTADAVSSALNSCPKKLRMSAENGLVLKLKEGEREYERQNGWKSD